MNPLYLLRIANEGAGALGQHHEAIVRRLQRVCSLLNAILQVRVGGHPRIGPSEATVGPPKSQRGSP